MPYRVLYCALSPLMSVFCTLPGFQSLVGKYIDGEGDGARGVKRKAVASTATTIASSSTSTGTSSSAAGPQASSTAQAKSEAPTVMTVGSKPLASAEPPKSAR